LRGSRGNKEGELNDEKLDELNFIREYNKRKMEAFTKYQQGTEDLAP
jgi:hypothetical protein